LHTCPVHCSFSHRLAKETPLTLFRRERSLPLALALVLLGPFLLSGTPPTGAGPAGLEEAALPATWAPPARPWVIPVKHYIFQYLISLCAATGVPLEVGLGLVVSESDGKPWATHRNRNGTWDRGLLQHNSDSHADMVRLYNNGREFDPYDVPANLGIALAYLADLHKVAGTWGGAVILFSAGPNYRGAAPAVSVAEAKNIVSGSFLFAE